MSKKISEQIKEIRFGLEEYCRKRKNLGFIETELKDYAFRILTQVSKDEVKYSKDDCFEIGYYCKFIEEILNGTADNEVTRQNLLYFDRITMNDKVLSGCVHNESDFKEIKIQSEFKTVYLDMNIISEMINNQEYERIKNVMFVYGPEHIEEIAQSNVEFHEKFLKGISKITDDIEVRFYDKGGYVFGNESPDFVYQKRVLPEERNINIAKELKVIDYLSDNIKRISKQFRNPQKYNGTDSIANPTTFCHKYCVEINEVLNCIGSSFFIDLNSVEKSHYMEYEERNSIIHELYRVMDIMGYRQDKISDKKIEDSKGYSDPNYRKIQSSRCDIEHLLYGSCCDYFITKDQKLFYRAANIFYILNCNCKPLLLKNDSHQSVIENIENLLNNY